MGFCCLVSLAAVAAVLGGCGQEDDESGVRAVTASFYSALRADDGQAACAQLSVDVRAQIESQEQRDCRDAVTGSSSAAAGRPAWRSTC